jgi:superfamily I DNA/RNA helicase
MTVHLYLAPAGAGKTAWALHLAREAARDLRLTPRVVVPTQLQVRAWRRRLAAGGGTLGVRVGTFDALYTECLNASGEVFTELSDPIQYRLLRAVVDGMPLQHYAPLRGRPGFIQVLQRLVGELKSARILPDVFAQAVRGLGCGPRLSELAQVYSAYQERLQAQGWADRAGMAWLAVEALERRAPQVARDWPLLIVDGLDDLTEVQLALLKVLAGRVGELVLTLTGRVDGAPRPLVHHRFVQTARRVQEALQVQAEPLPVQHVLR